MHLLSLEKLFKVSIQFNWIQNTNQGRDQIIEIGWYMGVVHESQKIWTQTLKSGFVLFMSPGWDKQKMVEILAELSQDATLAQNVLFGTWKQGKP